MAKIFICGDIVNSTNKSCFWSSDIHNVIKDCDYAVCNFEGPIKSNGNAILKSGPHIFQKEETIKLLSELGFDLLLLANNHIFDYGKEGLNSTINEAEKNNLGFTGAGNSISEAYKPFFIKVGDLNVAIINGCEAQFGVLDGNDLSQESGYAWINHWLIDEAIVYAKKLADYVIVCPHAGLEDYSVPLIEWRERYKRLCDLGASCIISSHPHVPQGYENYKGKPIFYSLGNFYFDALGYKNMPDHSYSVILNITKKLTTFELVYHQKENGIICLSDIGNHLSIENLNAQLFNDEILSNIYLTEYEKSCRLYLKLSICLFKHSGSILYTLKRLIKKFISPKKFKQENEILLMHLFRNETYRWILQRAINLKSAR